MKHKHYILAVLAVASAVWACAGIAQAADGSIYLSPSSRSLPKGSSVAVAVRINAGPGVNAVQANLSYPADKLDYISTSYSGSAFSVQAESSGGGGSVHIARGSLSLVTGNQLVATVTFRARIDSGNATIAVDASSNLASDGGAVASSNTGATYTLTVPPVVTPAPPTPTPVPKDTTPPEITGIAVTARSANTFTVAWKTNEPATHSVEYGLDTKYGLTAPGPAEASDKPEIVVTSAFVQPLWTYHYRVKSIDMAGNVAVSPDQTVTTTGLPVTITIKDSAGRPLSGAQVTLNGQTLTTNTAGEVKLPAAVGSSLILVAYRGRTVAQSLVVDPSKQTAASTIVLAAAGQTQSAPQLWLTILAIAAGLLALAFVVIHNRLWRHLVRHQASLALAPHSQSQPHSQSHPQSEPQATEGQLGQPPK